MRYLVVLLLSGCATWVHQTKTEQEFHADRYECEKDAAPVRDGLQAMAMQDRCMKIKGWTTK